MEPVGPEGDVYLQPLNMTPTGETPADDQTAGATNVVSLDEL
jgi:hypothetical protein